jgi:hypothetical protein
VDFIEQDEHLKESTVGLQKIDGFVAFLDILGFSELVRRSSFDQEFEQYSNIICNTSKSNGNLNYVIFSDSVVINTEGKTIKNLLSLVQMVAEVMHRFLVELEVPVCGCISGGHFSRIQSGNGDVMIAGIPIVEAVRYEEKQDWVGAILSPSVLKIVPDVKNLCGLNSCTCIGDAAKLRDKLPWPFLIQRYQTIPFHSTSNLSEYIYDGFAVIPHLPPRSNPKLLFSDLKEYTEKLDILKMLAPNPMVQRKYQNSIIWVRYVESKLERVLSGWWDHLEK